MKITRVCAREVLDSRGNPTVEAEVGTANGVFRAIVPSGASTGSNEALELRDGGKRYGGKGVLNAVGNVNNMISKKITGMDCCNQEGIDAEMIELDGTPNKGALGANAILGVSMAAAKAGAAATGLRLYAYLGKLAKRSPTTMPVPQLNVMNGGKHAGLENDIQEQMFMPVGARSFREALRFSTEAYHALKAILKKKFGAQATLLGDEGGFVPPQLSTVEDRLEVMAAALLESGYEKKIVFAVDAASTEFHRDGAYFIGEKKYSAGELVDFYKSLASAYPVVSLEDGMAEDDWGGWAELTKKLGKKIQIVGDDLLVTNPARIRHAVAGKAANSLLLKLNQIGTVSESIEAAKLAFDAGWSVVVSHRSGESEDSFISDLVVGLGAGQSKFGAPARSDRNAKYNQLLRIEEGLGRKARYPGRKFR
ncbi:MAG: phosphopyruvate hydratase [Candidatus Micrarchaeota archaeon]|nr:phosphopyruvate hydratase [Candidatus Micrarchaeota archaeon]